MHDVCGWATNVATKVWRYRYRAGRVERLDDPHGRDTKGRFN